MEETMTTVFPVFKANIIFRGKIECLTGLHIGGSEPQMEIGGLNAFVLRDANTNYPYIPGSSIKGKMRHLLELVTGAVNDPIDGKLGNVSKDSNIVRVFGIGADEKENEIELTNTGLSRLIVRDAYPDETTIEMWEKLDSDLEYTEPKAENTIDRLTSAANPRFLERVVKGSRFNFELVYTVLHMEQDENPTKTNNDIRNILMALRLLETSALGKSGTRGYGKVRIHIEEAPIVLEQADYQEATENYSRTLNGVQEDMTNLVGLDKVAKFRYH